jgi:hypothetical protein
MCGLQAPNLLSLAHTGQQAMLSINYTFTTALVLSKVSLLFLFRRIFGMHKQWFRILWWSLLIWAGPLLLLTCMVFASILVAQGNGSPNTPAMAKAAEVISFYCAITYFGILVLPIGMVVGLQMDRLKRAGLIGIFSLGAM